jgi:hypothetical protein
MKITNITLLFLLFLSNAFATEDLSKSLAIKGKRSWVGLRGFWLANQAGDTKKAEQFFEFGYSQGKEFLEALRSGKIKEEDIRSELPVIMLFLLHGPTDDFILGRMFESTNQGIYDTVYKDIETNEELKKLKAKEELSRGNYNLILQQ